MQPSLPSSSTVATDAMPRTTVGPRLEAAAGTPGFDAWMRHQLGTVETALQQWVPADAPASLGLAMRYGVLDGGKRLRPLLVLAAAQACDGGPAAALRAACAVELIHAYSLIHDDMPCMDNDVLRRGKPTVHVQFGQAQAMLAGDAMQALAFELLTPDDAVIDPTLQATLVRLLSRAAGFRGMAGGQAIDLASVGRSLDESTLRDMHERKTGALLRVSVEMGAACGQPAPSHAAALQAYGEAVGLAFQVVDDILDVTQATDVLGKTAGKDEDQDKPTYVSLMGLEAARDYAVQLHARALAALSHCHPLDTLRLRELADLVIHRTY